MAQKAHPTRQSIWIRCIWCNNLRIDYQCQRASPVSACLALTWTQDMQTAISAKPADMEGCRRGRAEIKLCHTWTTAVSPGSPLTEVRVVCQGHAQSLYEGKDPLIEGAQMLSCYFLFCRPLRYWVSGVDSADVITPPPPQKTLISVFVCFFLWCVFSSSWRINRIHHSCKQNCLTARGVTADRTVSGWHRLYPNSY